MLPMADVRYRRSLVATLGLGLAGAAFALVYSGLTGWGTRTLFGEPTSGVLVGKMLAVGLSLEAGFLAGTVFPMLFIGGTAGLFVDAVKT